MPQNADDEFLKFLVTLPTGKASSSKRQASWTSPLIASRASEIPRQISEI
jgi:hypothetical protein